MCTRRASWLLFTHQGAAGGRYRAVPDRYLFDAGFRLGDGAWEALQIPVRVAFFHNSDLGRVAGFYPSPAGATESLLPLEAWAEVVAANPVMTDLVLVGLVRMHWKGLDGGQEAWEAIDGFLDAVRERSRVP
jgi:hypothetical protein